MIYLQKLTQHLINNGIEKDHLESWAEDGTLFSDGNFYNDGFERTYTAVFEISNTSINPNFLDALVLSFLDTYDTTRLSRGLDRPQFFVEALQGGRFDVGYKIEFKEKCTFNPSEEGQWLVNGQTMDLTETWPETLGEAGVLLLFDSVTQDLEKMR